LGLQLASSGSTQTPGMVDTNFPAGFGSDTRYYPIVVQNDGKVLVGGTFTSPAGISRTNIVRLNLDGTLDTNFLYVGTGSAYAVQPDGKVIVGKFTSPPAYFVQRLNGDGSLDPSYTNRLTAGGSGLNEVAIQPADGKALIAGSFSTVNGTNRNGLARLNTDGSLDLSFQDWFPGFAVVNIYAIAVQADGKVLIGGYFDKTTNPTRKNIARLNIDGTVDNTFNPIIALVEASNFASIEDLVVQSDSKILVGGAFSSVNGVARRHIARLNANGTLDTNFQPIALGGSVNYGVYSIVLEDHGHVLLGGFPGITRPYIARLNPDGSMDTSFEVGLGPDSYVDRMALQPNGGVVVRGEFTSINGIPRDGLARLHAGLIRYNLDEPIPLPAGRSGSEITNAPTVVPSNRAHWDSITKNLYPTTVGDVTITWHFAKAPTNMTVIGTIVPMTTKPSLRIEPLPGGQVRLLWPTNGPPFRLESTAGLNPAVWSAVQPPGTVVVTNHVVTNATSGTVQFYRLINP
jgi:uncharacterized delta-60 repeat protein